MLHNITKKLIEPEPLSSFSALTTAYANGNSDSLASVAVVVSRMP